MTSTVDIVGPTHEIHTSGRKSYKGCRRRWNWIFNEQYYPKMTPKPLEFGTAFHAALEVYYDPKSWKLVDPLTRMELALAKFVDVCLAQKQAFLEVKDMQYLDDDVEEDYNDRVELGKGMLYYYLTEVSPKQDTRFTPLYVEIPFSVPIVHPATGEILICECHNLPVTYNGRIDMLCEDENGGYWVFDWKTTARMIDNAEFLSVDEQIGSYVWALCLILNLPVKGFVYCEIKKSFPQPPKRNVNKRLGRQYSVAVNQDTELDMFIETVKEEDTEAYEEGLYDEYITYLREEKGHYWARHQIHKNEAELFNLGVNIFYEAWEMTRTTTPIYPNAGRFSCMTCAFLGPCIGMNDGSDYEYTLNTLFEKREHYWLRETPSTETKGGE